LESGSSLGDLKNAVHAAFGAPSPQQSLVVETDDPSEAFTLCGSNEMPLASALDLKRSLTLRLVRGDVRSTSEKNNLLLQSLLSCRFEDAHEVLVSGGHLVDPNCAHQWCRDPNEKDSALVMAIRSLDGADASVEAQLLTIIEELLCRGADVNATGYDSKLSHGCWWRGDRYQSPLLLAVSIGSLATVKLLVHHGANCEVQNTHSQSLSCWEMLQQASKKGRISETSKTEMLDLLGSPPAAVALRMHFAPMTNGGTHFTSTSCPIQ